MISSRPTIRRRFLAGLVPLLLALGALPLLAPTCSGGGEGTKVFSRRSLIIPMDVCYQSQADGNSRTHTYTPASCPGAQDPGSIIKAYGLVYELIKANIAVYWIIDQNKTSLTGYDLQVQYNGGFPVLRYNWAGGEGGAPAITGNIIRYLGGPFVVDGSDYQRAVDLLQTLEPRFGPSSGNGTVNIHVSQVAFQGYAKKTLAGGWNAGGAVAPKLALLNIGSGNLSSGGGISSVKNAEPVISGYLIEAGIGAGGGTTAAGNHGAIYDRLTLEDFMPASGVGGDVHTSNLFTNGYEILWVPHWVAPGSCSNYSSSSNCLATQYGTAKTTQVLKTIGTFVAEGHDLFAECAGMGSFDGTFSTDSPHTAYSFDYKTGWPGDATNPSTRFISTQGLRINEPGTPAAAFPPGNFGSPLLQLGDYGFTPLGGAIESSRPQDNTGYQPDYNRLITAGGSNSSWDYFVLRPRVTGSNRGTIVYLAGHSYSGTQGYPFQVAGTRLVLNTLFNLGAACTASGVACDTGKLGVCGTGRIQCVSGQPQCVQTVFPSAEVCDGLDNDCNGLVDDMDTACYTGASNTLNVGVCHAGIRSCQFVNGSYQLSSCIGQVTPGAEVCNGLDDNCNGQTDEGLTQACYTGPSSSLGLDNKPRGICKAGIQACSGGSWGACNVCADSPCTSQTCLDNPADPICAVCASCQILPHAEVCVPGAPRAYDENCDGQVDEPSAPTCGGGCGTPNVSTQVCYTAASSTLNVGVCHAGTQTCQSTGSWGPCVGQVIPTAEVCTPSGSSPADENCNNQTDEGCGCTENTTQDCYTGDPANLDLPTPAQQARAICKAGKQTCSSGEFQGACVAEILPTPEVCDGWDNDCDGTVDDGATCATGFTCEHGVCAPSNCGVENICPEGYKCETPSGESQDRCVRDLCDGVTCADGAKCEFGVCQQLCPAPGEEPICWDGAYCQSGGCVGGSCYYTGCVDVNGDPTGELCQNGSCKPNPCADVSCPAGTFCRQGDCVQSCAFVSCAEGQKCSTDGFCEPDPCASVTCDVGQECVDGSCVADVCLGKGCGAGQVCEDQVCVDDPCTGVVCPAGKCLMGQCYPVGNPDPGIYNPPGSGSSSSGCGCGEGAASPLAALLFLFLVPLARRRRAGGRGALLVLVASAALLASACGKKSDGTPFQPGYCSGGWISCEGENSCIDVYTDSGNCGGCGVICGEGQKCVDKVCGPSTAVAPHITALDPLTGNQGSGAATVTLTGERFEDGATVRSVTTTGTSTLTPEFVDSGHLKVTLDLSSSDPSTIYLRVVNPDKVISNNMGFDIVTPTPQITGIDPASVKTGVATVVTVHGSGFLSASRCHLNGGGLAFELVLFTELSGSDLKCTVDATSLTPRADYQLSVSNPADPTPLESAPVTLVVDTDQPVLTDVSPNQAGTSEVASFMLGGTGFDTTSVALWDGGVIPSPALTILMDSQHLYVTQYVMPSSAATHQVQVRNGSGAPYKTSGSLPFVVSASGAQTVTSVSPGSAYQADTGVVLTVTGSLFNASTKIQMQPPGGSWTTLTTTFVNASTVTATVSFAGAVAGDWLVRLDFGGGANSATLPFRVYSNTAVLVSATPRSAAQQAAATPTTAVTMTVSNLRAPAASIRVNFSGAASPITPASVNLATGTIVVNLSMQDLQTGTYTLAVTNPNAVASNTLSFNVTPGAPVVASVNPTSFSLPTSGTDIEAIITVTGDNFARPDSQDNAGSVVHIKSDALGITDFPVRSTARTSGLTLPYAVVTDANHISVHLDKRNAVPGTYDVAVWNAGSANPPQKSNWLLGAFTVNP